MNVPKVDSNLDAILDTLEASAIELLSVAKPWEVNRKEAALWVTLDRSLRLSEPWFPHSVTLVLNLWDFVTQYSFFVCLVSCILGGGVAKKKQLKKQNKQKYCYLHHYYLIKERSC